VKMPRARPRCIFIYLVSVFGCFFVIFNIHQVYFSFPIIPPPISNTNKDSTDARKLIMDNTNQNNDSFFTWFRKIPQPEALKMKENTKIQKKIEIHLNLPFYMTNGSIMPEPDSIPRSSKLFPEESPHNDRIIDQLMFLPPNSSQISDEPEEVALKTILMWNGLGQWGGVRGGRGEFLKQKCPVSTCVLTSDRKQQNTADLILFKDMLTRTEAIRPKNQIWMLYMLECPLHTGSVHLKSAVNWTATYRTDSTIVTPYEKWVPYDSSVAKVDQNINFAANKTKKVAWFVSNCGARNGRLQYARELSKYIGVDIYGSCGNYSCPRTERCFKMLDTDYKFYLAFENSNCKDYITEKFFVNGLGHNVLPIVMGAELEEYQRVAPQNSFIHVNQFKGPKELAEYLHVLDQDDKQYNEYFKWKGTGEFINTRFFCRVCSLLHDYQKRPKEKSHYQNINSWWRGTGVCETRPWSAS